MLKACDVVETKDEMRIDMKADATNQQASALLRDDSFAGPCADEGGGTEFWAQLCSSEPAGKKAKKTADKTPKPLEPITAVTIASDMCAQILKDMSSARTAAVCIKGLEFSDELGGLLED